MFDSSVIAAINKVADSRRINRAALCAVAHVESGGIAYTRVDGVNLPVIRIEGHYFDRLVPSDKQALARKAGLASPTAGAVKNPISQEARYRMFTRMHDIDPAAAIMSCSWGVGQVMGVHWKNLGFVSPEALYMAARSIEGQVELMVRFIERNGLLDEIERQDWAGFARGYNGPAFKKNKYDENLAAAFAGYGGKSSISPATGMLRLGSRGAGVREIQTLLVRAGYTVTVDGDFGPATRDALKSFQRVKQLTVDGVAGPETVEALKGYQVTPAEKPGALAAMQVPQVNAAVKSSGALAVVISLRDQISLGAQQLTGIGTETANQIANGLMAGSTAIGVGLAIWGLIGWLRSGKTVEQ